MGRLGTDIWTSLKAAASGIAAAVAFGLALLGSLWDPGIKVQIGLIWVAVLVLCVVAVLAASIRMTMEARRSDRALPLRVLHVFASERTGDEIVKPLTLRLG